MARLNLLIDNNPIDTFDFDDPIVNIDGVCINTSCCQFYDNGCEKSDLCMGRKVGGEYCYYIQAQKAKYDLTLYKKSKQASYEAMQAEWNNAVQKLREVESHNELLAYNINKFQEGMNVIRRCVRQRGWSLTDSQLMDIIQDLVMGSTDEDKEVGTDE